MNKKDEFITRIGDTEIKNSEYEKILEIKVYVKLNFNEHLNDIICKSICKVKELQNYKRKLFLCPPQKYAKT